MQQFDTTFNISKELLREREQAICTTYGHKQQHNVNELRYYLFGSLTADPSILPPCQDASYKHIMCSNYQAAIWRRSLLAPPPPTWTWLEGESKQHFHRLFWSVLAVSSNVAKINDVHAVVLTLTVPVPVDVNLYVITLKIKKLMLQM